MKFRTAKKIMWSSRNSWRKRFRELRPPYINDDGFTVLPSLHDLDIVVRARTVFLRHIKREKKKWNH